MLYKLSDPVTVKLRSHVVHYFSLSNFLENTNWNFVNHLSDSHPTGKLKYEFNSPRHVVFDIFNRPIPVSIIQNQFRSYIDKKLLLYKSKYHINIPIYRRGPIDGVRKYSASGWRIFRTFRHRNEQRALEDLRVNEDAKYYKCFPRGKRMNHPNPWDDYHCEFTQNWKQYRKKQYKTKNKA